MNQNSITSSSHPATGVDNTSTDSSCNETNPFWSVIVTSCARPVYNSVKFQDQISNCTIMHSTLECIGNIKPSIQGGLVLIESKLGYLILMQLWVNVAFCIFLWCNHVAIYWRPCWIMAVWNHLFKLKAKLINSNFLFSCCVL